MIMRSGSFLIDSKLFPNDVLISFRLNNTDVAALAECHLIFDPKEDDKKVVNVSFALEVCVCVCVHCVVPRKQ